MSYFKIIILFSLFVYTGFFHNLGLASGDLLLSDIDKKEKQFFQINQVLAKNHVLPRYQVFANETIKLDNSAKKFCLAPDSASLTELREVFHSAADAWIRVEHINFGPVEENLRLYRINFWPDKHNTGSKHLARTLKSKDKTMIEPNKFSLNSVALQGFPALERLLFSRSDELFKKNESAKFRCNLIKAISRNLREIASSLLVEWVEENSTYLNKDSYQNNQNNFEERENFQNYFASLYGILRKVHDLKLHRPLGETPEMSKPKKSESWRSGRSMRNIIINLESAQKLFQGEVSFGMDNLIQNITPETYMVRDFNITMNFALKTAREIPIPLHKAVIDYKWHDQVDKLKAQISRMMAMVRARIFLSFGIGTGFNFLDGDSI